MNEQAERVLKAILAKGVDQCEVTPGVLRHAVHEAAHGIRLNVPKWTNEKIHRACMKARPGDRFREELIARAVEQLVCARLGVVCGTVEHFAYITCMESLKNRLDIGSIDSVVAGVRRFMEDTKTVAPLVEQILAMGAVQTTDAQAP